MKRLFAIILFILSISTFVASANGFEDPYNGFYGLLKELTDFEVSDFSKACEKKDIDLVINSLFNEAPFKDSTVTNSDLAKYLEKKCRNKSAVPPLDFYDAGLLNEDLRRVYSVLNANGKIFSADGFLNPENPLTYDFLVGTLSKFENEILENLSFSSVKGSIISISLENGITNIRLQTNQQISEVSFKNMAEKNVFKEGITAPYSRNLERGDIITVYKDQSDNGFYVKATGEYFDGYDILKEKYKLYKGYVYYFDNGKAIIKDLYEFNGYKYTDFSPDTYNEFDFNEKTLLKYNFNPTYIDYINNQLLDKPIYIICDNNNLKANYFNIAE